MKMRIAKRDTFKRKFRIRREFWREMKNDSFKDSRLLDQEMLASPLRGGEKSLIYFFN